MSHPYESLPPHRRWSQAVGKVPAASVSPAVGFPIKIELSDKVATGGSCFAQHIATRLAQSGFNYLVTEPGHPIAPPEIRRKHQYGVFSARYGNIYTVRQLLQLFQEALGKRRTSPSAWEVEGRFLDPLRPAVEPDGFSSLYELRRDRLQHLEAVRRMLAELDVFVFTLGLTEAWESTADGTVYPLCPGVKGGMFDATLYRLHNFNVDETVADLVAVFHELTSVNPKARMILTVSPVALVATAEERHVLEATTYSKSVLRVAAETVAQRFPGQIGYFPSYEIITGPHSRGAYFADDLRSVTTEGVDHVMRIFFERAVSGAPESTSQDLIHGSGKNEDNDGYLDRMAEITRLICEEELLDQRA